MKTTITLALAGIFVLSLSACKKDRTCTCTWDDGDKTTTTYTKVRKRDVRQACLTTQTTSFDAKSNISVTGQKRTCELK